MQSVTENIFGEQSLGFRAIQLTQWVLETSLDESLVQLRSLTDGFKATLAAHELQFGPLGMDQKRECLFHYFYQKRQFCGNWQEFFLPKSALLSEVLRHQKGGPMAMGVLLLHIAQHYTIALEGVNFPGHFLLRFDCEDGKRCYFDPFSQEILTWTMLEARLKGAVDPITALDPDEHLVKIDNDGIIKRLLEVMKGAFIRAGLHWQALRCNEQLLEIDPDDPYEIRDRGFLFEQLDCYQIAVSDYEYFLAHCPDDPVVPLLKLQVQALEKKESILH